MKNYIKEYYEKIQSGEIIACQQIKRIYRYLNDICDGKYTDCYYDSKKAEKVIAFIELFCKNSKGAYAGKSLKLLLWQKAFLSAVYGIINKKTGYRKFTETLLEVARKNGKSGLSSALLCYSLFADGEEGAEIYCGATKKDQAKIVFEEAKRMVKSSPILNEQAKCIRDKITFNNSVAMPVGADSNRLDGLNASVIFLDEIHSFKDDNLYHVLRDSQSFRNQPLTIMITTAGFVRESIFDKKVEEADIILTQIDENRSENKWDDDGIVFLPFIYTQDNWKKELGDKTQWIKSNPSLGRIKSVKFLSECIAEARRTNSINNLLTKHFDIIRNNEQAYFVYEDVKNKSTFDMHEIFDDKYVILGMDLSKTTDLSVLTMITKVDNTIYVHQKSWMPTEMFEKRLSTEKIPYQEWHENKYMDLCPGNSVNYHQIIDYIHELIDTYNITVYKLGYDSWSARYVIEELEDYFGRGVCEPVIQGYKTLSQPMGELKATFQDKNVNYNNNPMLLWGCLNVVCVEDRNGNLLPDKRDKRQKIDNFASLLDAYVSYTRCKQEFDALNNL